jgi:hypothetical protein
MEARACRRPGAVIKLVRSVNYWTVITAPRLRLDFVNASLGDAICLVINTRVMSLDPHVAAKDVPTPRDEARAMGLIISHCTSVLLTEGRNPTILFAQSKS